MFVGVAASGRAAAGGAGPAWRPAPEPGPEPCAPGRSAPAAAPGSSSDPPARSASSRRSAETSKKRTPDATTSVLRSFRRVAVDSEAGGSARRGRWRLERERWPALPTCSATYRRAGSGSARMRWPIFSKSIFTSFDIARSPPADWLRRLPRRPRPPAASVSYHRHLLAAWPRLPFSSSLSGANGDGSVFASTTR